MKTKMTKYVDSDKWHGDKAQHTPGPWCINGEQITGNNDEGCIIAQIECKIYDERLAMDEAKANGLLIAAAPELLEALQVAKAVLASHELQDSIYDAARNKINEAITKATS